MKIKKKEREAVEGIVKKDAKRVRERKRERERENELTFKEIGQETEKKFDNYKTMW